MRLKRSTLSPCPECGARKYLDIRIDRGGSRYIDLFAIECQWDTSRGKYMPSIAEAIEEWNKGKETV